jgi:hypothetical protein
MRARAQKVSQAAVGLLVGWWAGEVARGEASAADTHGAKKMQKNRHHRAFQ